MSNITVKTVNMKTGETMEGTVAYLPKKHNIFKDGYLSVSQTMLFELIKDDLIPNSSWKLFCWLLPFIGMNNVIPYTMSDLIRKYPHTRESFYKALRPLLAVGIFIPHKQEGANKYYALNSNLGWKGKIKDWYINDPEDPLYNLDGQNEAC